MKKMVILVTCLCLLPSLSQAETFEAERRIEQEKRDELRPSEPRIAEEGNVPVPPISPEDLVYFSEMAQKRISFRYDACKAIVLLMGVEDKYIDLDSQIAYLRENHLLPKRFESVFDPMLPLRSGLVAYMFYNALDIKGGLCLWFLGVNERYALKELAYEGIMASGNVNDIVSGEELVSILMQASDYLVKKQQAKTSQPKE